MANKKSARPTKDEALLRKKVHRRSKAKAVSAKPKTAGTVIAAPSPKKTAKAADKRRDGGNVGGSAMEVDTAKTGVDTVMKDVTSTSALMVRNPTVEPMQISESESDGEKSVGDVVMEDVLDPSAPKAVHLTHGDSTKSVHRSVPEDRPPENGDEPVVGNYVGTGASNDAVPTVQQAQDASSEHATQMSAPNNVDMSGEESQEPESEPESESESEDERDTGTPHHVRVKPEPMSESGIPPDTAVASSAPVYIDLTQIETSESESESETDSNAPTSLDPALDDIQTAESDFKSKETEILEKIDAGIRGRVRKPYLGHWQIFSSGFYKLWRAENPLQVWDPPGLLVRPSEHLPTYYTYLDPLQTHKTHFSVHFSIGGVGMRTDPFRISKKASRLPFRALATAEKDGGKTLFDVDIHFMGDGYLSLRIPQYIAEQAVRGVVDDTAVLGWNDGVVFCGIQL